MIGIGILVIGFVRPQNRTSLLPHADQGIRIENEAVYINGTVHFTARSYFLSYGGYPRPSGDQYQIQFVYLWLIQNHGDLMEFTTAENGSLVFNQTLGEIQKVSQVTIDKGNLNLAIDDEVTIRFQVSYQLHPSISIYVGVMAEGPSGLRRWERNTTVIEM
ncbi:MAG: hypothetical protein ACFFFG_02485 [Candidatus Thorarchaeota archaeon]